MTKHKLDALARDLTADPARPVDGRRLRSVDREDLAAALRRSVADLPAAEQRARLARAFAVVSLHADPGAAVPARADSGPRSFPMLTPIRIGVTVCLIAIAAAGGVLVGLRTDDATPVAGDEPPISETPVLPSGPVIRPIATGPEPSAEYLAGLLPTDTTGEIEALRQEIETHPKALSADERADALAELSRREAAGSDGPVGGGPETDAPTAGDPGTTTDGLVDLCAGDDAPAYCEGVGGTIETIVRAFRFNADPEAWNTQPCTSEGELPAGRFAVTFQTSNLGDFTARFRIAGSGAEWREARVTSPELWRDALDDGYPQVITCLVAPRPVATETMLDFEVTGVGVDDSGTDTWAGTLRLPAEAVLPERREGRPPVQVEAETSSSLVVHVPLGDDEDADVQLVPRPGTTADPCVADTRTGAIDATSYPEAEPIGGITLMGWHDREYRVSAEAAGAYAVCVDWYDDGTPRRNVERASVPVVINAVTTGQVLLAGYVPGTGAADLQPGRLQVALDRPDGRRCGVRGIGPEDFGGSELSAETLCTYDGAPGHVGIDIETSFTDSSGDIDTRRVRGRLATPPACAPGVDCTAWFLVRVHRPGEVDPVGGVLVGLRVNGTGANSVEIGAERAVQNAADEVTGPRLVWDEVDVTPATGAPSHALQITWRTDAPARVRLAARPRSSAESCPIRHATEAGPVTSGSLRIGNLCPGVSYFVAFDVSNDDGRTVYDVTAPATPGAAVVARSAVGATRPVEVRYDYRLQFQTFDDAGVNRDLPVVPTNLGLTLFNGSGQADTTYQWSQWFTGTARNELDCANIAHYDRAGSGIAATLTGGTFPTPELYYVFHLYNPVERGIFDSVGNPTCPSLYNQVQHTPTIERQECAFVVSGLRPYGPATGRISRMLDGETARYVGEATCPNWHIRLVATLDITLHPQAHALRGG